MTLPEGPRRLLLGILFLAASFLLYLGMAIWLFNPAGYHQTPADQATPLLFIVPALLLVCGIAFMLRRQESDPYKGRDLQLTLPLSLGIVALGALVISVAILRHHWLQFLWR